jgi:hypothetical protein
MGLGDKKGLAETDDFYAFFAGFLELMLKIEEILRRE